ncbi:DNA glycosylase [Elsinoe ampelina]|uniref:Endonuclease III homolog n=1 Tax=Elsinoe ampelina TaxID=302913 RepID=A0A6A6G488_9PEZI|nr:DNA glycosylase [Elsinoe ampelina]
MKTSRVSQDTARIMSSISNRRSSARIASAASTRSLSTPIKADRKEAKIKTEDVDSETSLSSAASTEDAAVATPATSVSGVTPLKRKRGIDTSPVTARRSPRKASPSLLADLEDAGHDGLFPRPTRRQPSKRIKGHSGDTVLPPPTWEKVYQITQDMRTRRVAAVDTMGCENLADDTRSPRDRRLQTLIALMLSSQTKDPVTAAAIKNMQDHLPGGFCLESLLEVDPPQLNSLINKVGFHNNKTRYIKATAEILRDQFGGEIPDTIEGLVSLPGVGPKMAYLTMSAAWGRDEGIGVDVHVHRITNLWGWHKTRNPEETRAELEAWLPREKWHEINHLLVGFGQTWCPPVGRRCEECDLAKEGLCPSAVVPKELKRKVKREVKVEGGEVVVKKEEASEEVLVKANEEAPPLVLSDMGEVKDEGVKAEVVVA